MRVESDAASRGAGGVQSASRRASDAPIEVACWIAMAAVAAMMLIISAEVIARSLFGWSLLIMDELAGYLLVVMTFFGAAYCLREGALLRIELLFTAISPRASASLSVLFDLCALLLVLLFLHRQILFTWSTWSRGMVAPTLSEIPLWIPQIAIPIGGLLLSYGLVLEIRDGLLRMRPGVGRVKGRQQAEESGQ
jgi:TRAP-type C4-dicarboxylate transport system permease small subunit